MTNNNIFSDCKLSPRIVMLLLNPFLHDPRVSNEAKSLTKHGMQVTIISTRPTEDIPSFSDASGIIVRRISLKPTTKKFSFPMLINILMWNVRSLLLIDKIHKKEGFSLIHCHDLDTLPLGIFLKYYLGIPLIYDAHEIYAYQMEGKYSKSFMKLIFFIESIFVNFVNCVITVNEPLFNYFDSIRARDKIIVENCKHLTNVNLKEQAHSSPFIISYIGNLQENRYILEIIEAIKGNENVEFHIGGDGDSQYVGKIEKECILNHNILFYGEVPLDKAESLLKSTDLIIRLSNPSNMNDKVGLPNKVFEAMAYAKPIVVSKGTYLEKFVSENGCGIAIENSVKEIRKCITRMMNDQQYCNELGHNGARSAAQKYNWLMCEKKLIKLYSQLLTIDLDAKLIH